MRRMFNWFSILIAIVFSAMLWVQREPLADVQKIYIGLIMFEYTLFQGKKNEIKEGDKND